MFTAEAIQARMRGRPFIPVRIITTTGETYDIQHPDLVLTGRRFLMIGMPTADNPTVAEQVTRVAMEHVTDVRDLPVSAPPSNGSANS
jgi:hypothetical protein